MILGAGGGIYWMEHGNKEVYQAVQDKVEEVKEVVQEPTEEDKRLAEIMKVKEQEAKLELKRDMLKEEYASGTAEFEARIKKLNEEKAAYDKEKSSEIKSAEAELANFIKATSVSKN